MSELRSKFPQAQAWTFVCDDSSPPASSSSASAPRAGAAPRRAAAPRSRKKGNVNITIGTSTSSSSSRSSSCGSGRSRDGESMGGMCSSNKNVANKENMAGVGRLDDADMDEDDQHHALLGTQTADALAMFARSDRGAERSKYAASAPTATVAASSAAAGGGARARNSDRGAGVPEESAGVLESTALLSPEQVSSDDVPCPPEMEAWAGEGECGDRTAWLARSLGQLRAGVSVDAEELKQVSGLEECLHELLSDRARHLSAMEHLTTQLRRREADAEKIGHDLKALQGQLEIAEYDKASLEQRALAASEEHRMDRARWFVHKQELEVRYVQLESRDSQYRAAIRKREADYGRLQESMRRAVQKESRGAAGGGRGVARGLEATYDLSPGEAGMGGGRAPLGAVVNEQMRRKTLDLEKENSTLRSMLVDLQADVVDVKGYHDRHGDLVSAGRAADDGIWGLGGETDADPLAEEAIEGMPADWLKEQMGEETARQISAMRGAVTRILGEGSEGADAQALSGPDLASLVSQLREARSLLREQDAIMLAAIFDRPGAETVIASNRQRCVCGGEYNGVGGSGMWDTRERLELEREELERARAKLEKDKSRFLEEAVRRDSKSFVFSCPPGTPASPGVPGSGVGDVGLSTPGHYHRHLAATGTLMVPSSPCPTLGDSRGMPLLTFTPPAASPDTARLLGQLGIEPGENAAQA